MESIVSSSKRTTAFCEKLGIETADISNVSAIDTYVDGVDQIDPDLICIKGQGGAMTGEKLCAEIANKFIAIA